MKNNYTSVLLIFAVLLSSCSDHFGTPEKPVELPHHTLTQIVDMNGVPVKRSGKPVTFVVSLNNQTEWYLTYVEIRVASSATGRDRFYGGTPYAYDMSRGRHDTVRSIAPKSIGMFLFNIDHLLSWEEQPEAGSTYKKEIVFEPYEWNIVKAKGYKN